MGKEPTFWIRLAEDLAEYEPEAAVRLVAGALTSRSHDTRELAKRFLIEMAAAQPGLVMGALGEAFLDGESGALLQQSDLSTLIRSIPEPEVRAWIQAGGAPAARAIARHLVRPYVDDADTPVVPPLTEFVLQRFEDDDRVFRAFLLGTHAGQVYEGDIPAQYRDEERIARRFLSHPLRRVQEWAKSEAESARQHSKFWTERDEEDAGP